MHIKSLFNFLTENAPLTLNRLIALKFKKIIFSVPIGGTIISSLPPPHISQVSECEYELVTVFIIHERMLQFLSSGLLI